MREMGTTPFGQRNVSNPSTFNHSPSGRFVRCPFSGYVAFKGDQVEHRSFGAPHHTHTQTRSQQGQQRSPVSRPPHAHSAAKEKKATVLHWGGLGRLGVLRLLRCVRLVCLLRVCLSFFLLCLSPVVLPDVFVLSAFCCCLCLNDANSAITGLFILSNQGRHTVLKKNGLPFQHRPPRNHTSNWPQA